MRGDFFTGLLPDLQQSVLECKETAAELARNLELLSTPGYLDRQRKVGGWEAVFGKVLWPLTQFAALELVEAAAGKAAVAWPLDPECRPTFSQLLVDLGEEARLTMASDFEKAKDRAMWLIPDIGDFGHSRWELDVWKLGVIGAEMFWPEMRFEESFDGMLVGTQAAWIKTLHEVLRSGGFVEKGEVIERLRPSDVVAEDIDWLPNSWWWRHLSEWLGQPASVERP